MLELMLVPSTPADFQCKQTRGILHDQFDEAAIQTLIVQGLFRSTRLCSSPSTAYGFLK